MLSYRTSDLLGLYSSNTMLNTVIEHVGNSKRLNHRMIVDHHLQGNYRYLKGLLIIKLSIIGRTNESQRNHLFLLNPKPCDSHGQLRMLIDFCKKKSRKSNGQFNKTVLPIDFKRVQNSLLFFVLDYLLLQDSFFLEQLSSAHINIKGKFIYQGYYNYNTLLNTDS